MIGIASTRIVVALLLAALIASSSGQAEPGERAAREAPSVALSSATSTAGSPATGGGDLSQRPNDLRRAPLVLSVAPPSPTTASGTTHDSRGATALTGPVAPDARMASDVITAAGPTYAYGMGIAADTLANTQIGGTDNGPKTRVAYRFTVSRPTNLTKIRVYFEVGRGYSGGTGGTRRVSIRTDNGGVPSGTVLTSTTISGLKRFRTVHFPNAAHLVPGRYYYVVFKNIGPYPRRNFVSANALYAWDATVQPRYPTWAVLIDTNGTWRVRRRYLPILQISDASGSQGIGYMEAWQTKQPPIGGSAMVRERFAPRADLNVSSVSVRLKRATTGTSPVTATIAAADGAMLAQVTMPAGAFPVGKQCDCSGNHNGWGTASFPTVTLLAGSTYTLTLSSPADTIYRAEGIREGVDYGFSSRTYYVDGRMQRSSDGVTFTDVTAPYGGNAGEADLQFFLGP